MVIFKNSGIDCPWLPKSHGSYLIFLVLLLYVLGVIESFIYLSVCIMNTTPQKRPLFFLFFSSFFIFIQICFSSILVGGGSSFPNCMQQDYRTKLKKLRRKNRKWVIRMEKEIHFTVVNGYIKTNFGANFYWSKTEKELKLEHKLWKTSLSNSIVKFENQSDCQTLYSDRN